MTLEAAIIEHCSPTLAGLKPASLFRYRPEEPQSFIPQFSLWRDALRCRGLELIILKGCRRSGAYLVYLFRPGALERVLSGSSLREFLAAEGYNIAESARDLLRQLARRLCLAEDFPHEIGLFLGYPLEDVTGFIENHGQGYSCCGAWKSYGDPVQARRYFDCCRACTDNYKRRYAGGAPLTSLIVAA
jgi:hypothetical protein